jgi:Fibronectin type III domain/PKD domain
MGPTKWLKVAVAATLASLPLGMLSTAVTVHAASAPAVSVSASPNPALTDSDNVYLSAFGTHGNGCAIRNYTFDFGDGSSTTSTYAYAYHYYHVPVSLASETFTGRLTVRDRCGHTSSKSFAEVVEQDTSPLAKLTVTHSSSNGYRIFADASLSTGNAQASLYEFDFYWGDGTESTTYAPTTFATHQYLVANTYTTTVNVFDYAGKEGFKSQTVTVPIVAPPTAPSNVRAVAADSSATVSWSSPTSGGTPASYTVTASPGGAATTVGGTAHQATVTGLSDGTTYTFTVTATNGGGSSTSLPSNPVTPIAPPGAPTSVTATQDDAAAVVSWTASTNGVHASPLSHHQRRNFIVTTHPGGAQTTVSGNPSQTNTTISGLTNGIAYTFTVTETNAGGSATSQPSNSVTPQPIGPTISRPPGWMLVEPSTVGTDATHLALGLTVLWSGLPGSDQICSYALQHSVNNGPWADVSLLSATTTSASDTIPASPDTVRYQVQATGCDGVVSSWTQSPEFVYRLDAENNSKFTYSAGWVRTQCAGCAGGFDELTATANATATVTLTSAYNIGLVFAVGPTLGSCNVYKDGSLRAMVDTYSPTAGYRLLLFKTGWGVFGHHVIQVVNLGTAGHPGIAFDGAVVLYAPLAKLAML